MRATGYRRLPVCLALLLMAPGCDGGFEEEVQPARLGDPVVPPTTASRFGYALETLGDLDADGYDDLAVGAPEADDGSGQVYLMFGGGEPEQDPAMMGLAQDRGDGESFGDIVVAMGSDGVSTSAASHVAVSAPYAEHGSDGAVGEIAFYDLSQLEEEEGLTSASSVVGDDTLYFEYSMAVAADVLEQDGDDELVVGMRLYEASDDTPRNVGAVFVYDFEYDLGVASDLLILPGEYEGQELGSTVATGDVDGDGKVEIISGTNDGEVFVYFFDDNDGVEAVQFVVDENASGLGARTGGVAVTRPVSDDAAGEAGAQLLVVSQPACSDEGSPLTASVYTLDGARGVSLVSSILLDDEVTCNRGHFPLTGGFDLNDDGAEDAILGANELNGTGTAWLILGPELSPWPLTSGEAEDEFGWSVARAGDINGDAYPDAVIGTPMANGDDGAVQIYYGGNDIDADGFPRAREDGVHLEQPLDCDDLDSGVNPGAKDPDDDGVDQNCDGDPDSSGCGCGVTESDPPGAMSGARVVLRLWVLALLGLGVLCRRSAGVRAP